MEEQIQSLKNALNYWGSMTYSEGCKFAQEILLTHEKTILGMIWADTKNIIEQNNKLKLLNDNLMLENASLSVRNANATVECPECGYSNILEGFLS
jgi:hypothetical protein